VNHRRSFAGYHSLLAIALAGTVWLAACSSAPAEATGEAAESGPRSHVPGEPWQSERALVVDAINAARRAAGAPALVYDSLLERVGDLHCQLLFEEGGDGHFSVSGVPPYLRYLLAGGSGYHRENAFRYSHTGGGGDVNLRHVVLDGVAAMLAEKPPDDGHRQALLEAAVTHIGVGLAQLGGEVRMSHELATEVTESWAPPPGVAVPRSALVLSGRVAKPWRAAAASVLWQELPHPLTEAQASAIRSYGYPPQRMIFHANQPASELDAQIRAAPFTVDRSGNFTFRWVAGAHEGVEIALLWAQHGDSRELVPVAASATVVRTDAALPPALARWRSLAVHPPGS
jgi:uncharacterized protein YkwD